MELLTAAMKLFFKRPPELQKMLGKLLKSAIADVAQIDVRDRALLYFRLLKFDVHEVCVGLNPFFFSLPPLHCPRYLYLLFFSIFPFFFFAEIRCA